MADKKGTIPRAIRELLLAFPQAEEFESHGSPNFRACKGKVFAVFAVNHHGDGHVALWLNTPAVEQSRLIASSPKHIYKPPYVGPSGWIGVELNRGFSWKRVIELAHMAYANSSPPKLVATISKPPVVAAPTVKMTPEEIDRLKSAEAMKLCALMRNICLALPETDEGPSFGSPVWRVGKRGFASVYDYGKGLTVSFWVGIERQGPLEMDPRFSIPPYLGHNGWIALDASGGVSERELRESVIESYRHFATRRALAKLGGLN
ncbi:MAG TPA: MmcQ/YjbR family DNA-binding protein [Steroidobacteraceae bacterium]|jgi:predicted DNA-binding protein (MmcQ/YjbR family)|nr:MmcQ/YjbR family DNA-binding protein [Steroidobacteraceae bacterium]